MERLLSRPAAARSRRRPDLIALLRALLALRRQRHRLHDLSDHILDDIGVSRDAAEREAARPVWDVPRTWRR